MDDRKVVTWRFNNQSGSNKCRVIGSFANASAPRKPLVVVFRGSETETRIAYEISAHGRDNRIDLLTTVEQIDARGIWRATEVFDAAGEPRMLLPEEKALGRLACLEAEASAAVAVNEELVKTIEVHSRVIQGLQERLKKVHRLLILCDTQNINSAAFDLYGRRIDYERLFQLILQKHSDMELAAAVMFMADTRQYDTYADQLRWKNIMSYRCVPRPLANGNGRRTLDTNVDPVMQALFAPMIRDYKPTIVCVMTRDGDFAPKIREMKDAGYQYMLGAFQYNCSRELLNLADYVFDIDTVIDQIMGKHVVGSD